jgi:SAM-dependent methyltransferase
MFELASIPYWWKASENHPVFRNTHYMGILKNIGYCHVCNHVDVLGRPRILEIGHGPTSPLFDMFAGNCETWGIDDTDDTPYVKDSEMAAFRSRLPHTRFVIGLLGKGKTELPSHYFDIVCSVSVMEHIPLDQLNATFSEIRRVLKPGGLVVNSYDLPYRADHCASAFYSAHTTNGLYFLNAKAKSSLEWDARNVALEDGRVTMLVYLNHVTESVRQWCGNFGTILSAARKVE